MIRRKVGERVLIGDVWVTLVKCSGTGALLGIEAPDSTRVVREELLERDRDDRHTQRGNDR